MRLIFQTIAILLIALLLGACAASDTPRSHENQPHLSPPAFPVSDVAPVSEAPPVSETPPVSDVAAKPGYCGVRGVGGDVCGDGEFCRHSMKDQCGAADAPGVCTPIPVICTNEFRPVCGCDGNVYSNECAANSAGVSAASNGPCPG